MGWTKEQAQAFITLLREQQLITDKQTVPAIEQVSDALYVLKTLLKQGSMGGIWPEGIGTEQDANEDYESYLEGFALMSQGQLRFDNLSSDMVEDTVIIEFDDEGERVRWEFEQAFDQLSGEFIALLFAYSKTKGDSQLLDLKSEDMFEFAYVPDDVANFLLANGLAEIY